MKITKLTVAGLRAFTQAEFEFHSGMNLLVGVNGVGKTTVLDALCICWSKILPEISVSRNRKDDFRLSDIQIGAHSMSVSLDFEIKNQACNLLILKQKEAFLENEEGNPRAQIAETPDIEQITPSFKEIERNTAATKTQPLVVFFSTKRSLITEKAPSKISSIGGKAAAFAESLSDNREFNLRTFAEWFKAQEELGEELPISLRHIAVLREAVGLFLPTLQNLHVVEIEDKLHFMVEKAGIPLSIYQLSDGERGVLSMVLDLAKRLSQANPDLEDPLREGSAIVLIDELDLHLHPKWQRTIVENLTRTFPNCQFIATTHSPQIIGEVSSDCITIIDNGTFRPANSFGVDSSRILEEILDTPSRNKLVDEILNSLYRAIDANELGKAKELLSKLTQFLTPDDPEITRSSTMIDFLEEELTHETDN